MRRVVFCGFKVCDEVEHLVGKGDLEGLCTSLLAALAMTLSCAWILGSLLKDAVKPAFRIALAFLPRRGRSLLCSRVVSLCIVS